MARLFCRSCRGGGGTPPAPPKSVKLTSPAVTCWRQLNQLRAGKGGRGYRSERGGARRDSLPLRCPATTAQPDGPGSGRRMRRATCFERQLILTVALNDFLIFE